MIRFRIRYETAGGHTHMRVFAGDTPSSEYTLGKCGDLTMTNEEFDQFRAQFRGTNVEFREEG